MESDGSVGEGVESIASIAEVENSAAEKVPDNADSDQVQKNNKRRSSSSPSSQADTKKLHRDNLSRTDSEDSDVIEIDVDDTVNNSGSSKITPKSVRQKFYSDLLARTLATGNNAALSAELEAFQVEDPSDSLLASLFNFALRNNVPTEALIDSDSLSACKNLSLTPMIKICTALNVTY